MNRHAAGMRVAWWPAGIPPPAPEVESSRQWLAHLIRHRFSPAGSLFTSWGSSIQKPPGGSLKSAASWRESTGRSLYLLVVVSHAGDSDRVVPCYGTKASARGSMRCANWPACFACFRCLLSPETDKERCLSNPDVPVHRRPLPLPPPLLPRLRELREPSTSRTTSRTVLRELSTSRTSRHFQFGGLRRRAKRAHHIPPPQVRL